MLAVTSATPASTTEGWATPMAMRSASDSAACTVGDVTAHEHEPLAVHVGDDVARAGDRPQSLGDRLEQVRAGGVAEAFLHEGEVVELDRHHRQAAQVHVARG